MRSLHGRLIACFFSLLLLVAAPAVAAENLDVQELVRVAFLGDAAAVRKLLAAGVEPNSRAHTGNTALMAAADGGHPGVVRMLLDAGAKPDLRATYNWTALFVAVNEGQLEIARMLLDAGADPDIAPSIFGGGRGPLSTALGNGNVPMARLLLEAGADVNATTNYGATPLWFAVWIDSPEQRSLAKALIDAGADVDAGHQPSYRAPPSVSSFAPDGSVVIAPVRRSAEGTVLGDVSANGKIAYARMLIEAGADVNARQPGWRTPLMFAAAAGRTEVVRLLLQHGADPDAKDSDGRNALMHARLGGHQEIVRLLGER